MPYKVHSLSELITMGEGQGRQDSLQAALNRLESENWALHTYVPNHQDPSVKTLNNPWFIFEYKLFTNL